MKNSVDPDLQKPTDLDLHCLQRQGLSRFSRTRSNDKALLMKNAKLYFQAYADSEGPDQYVHPHSLNRVFAVC